MYTAHRHNISNALDTLCYCLIVQTRIFLTTAIGPRAGPRQLSAKEFQTDRAGQSVAWHNQVVLADRLQMSLRSYTSATNVHNSKNTEEQGHASSDKPLHRVFFMSLTVSGTSSQSVRGASSW